MRHCVHPLLSPSLGSSKTLVSLHYGPNDALKKVYIQASLHAEELPGMLVACSLPSSHCKATRPTMAS
jgi:predicted deacylase